MTWGTAPSIWDKIDQDILFGPKICGEKVREILKGKYEVIPTSGTHIKVEADKCTGCLLCYQLCPAGCYEMEDGKAVWKFTQLCMECGTCNYVCPVNAIDWSYPEAGTGIKMRNT